MITFLICLAALITAYFTYGKYLERLAGADNANATPCKRLADGVDYIEMPRWRVFLIQLLNIAGTGPIFGAILGACFGPVAFLWITLGGIFFGAMHDYLSGMMIVRNDGRSLPEVVGKYLGRPMRSLIRWFSVLLMILVGAVFMTSPAELLGNLVEAVPVWAWVVVILVYYIIATILPVDKVIGKCYPVFGAALILMALGLLGVILFESYTVPELTDLHNYHHNAEAFPIVPTLFITIACGAISGFHATQSPMMARCLTNEKLARPIFYGAMVAEGVVALIWAAAAVAFTGGYEQLSAYMAAEGHSAGSLVHDVSFEWLGTFGGLLALLGVVAAPITTGDTALRSARLSVADMMGFDQSKLWRRLVVAIPIFLAAMFIMSIDFNVLWRYFAWCNQTLAVFTLWAITVYLARKSKPYIISFIPACFMTVVCTSYLLAAPSPEGFGLEQTTAVAIGLLVAALVSAMFFYSLRQLRSADVMPG